MERTAIQYVYAAFINTKKKLMSVRLIFAPFVCGCLQLQDVELPAFLVIQHLSDVWRDIIQCDWDGQLALTHV